MKKLYNYGQADYWFSLPHRKWIFKSRNGKFTLIQKCQGKPIAEKISHVVNAGLNRMKGEGIDNMARSNIQRVINNS